MRQHKTTQQQQPKTTNKPQEQNNNTNTTRTATKTTTKQTRPRRNGVTTGNACFSKTLTTVRVLARTATTSIKGGKAINLAICHRRLFIRDKPKPRHRSPKRTPQSQGFPSLLFAAARGRSKATSTFSHSLLPAKSKLSALEQACSS